MRLRNAFGTIWSGIRMLFIPAGSLLPEVCIQKIRDAIRRDTMVMPDFSLWTNRNHLDVYLSRNDFFKLGGLEQELARRLEKAAAEVCREEGIRNPYGRFELFLRSHSELRPGEVYVDAIIDAGLPLLPAEIRNDAPMQFRTICMKEPGLDHTNPLKTASEVDSAQGHRSGRSR